LETSLEGARTAVAVAVAVVAVVVVVVKTTAILTAVKTSNLTLRYKLFPFL
jgi:hypothetical protein